MVAQSALTVRIEPMSLEDLDRVHAIERASFFPAWPDDAYRNELTTNKLATYLVARLEEVVIGFAGIWLMVDEAHVTTFAVDPAWRRRGVGERMLLALLDVSIARRAREATLEVRLSNMAARRLYEKYGFRPVGVRPRYYTDNGEDALIMTTDPLESPEMRARIARLREELDARTLEVPRPREEPAP